MQASIEAEAQKQAIADAKKAAADKAAKDKVAADKAAADAKAAAAEKAAADKAAAEQGALDAMTMSRQQAISKAKSYLEYSAFSRKGLINQLKYEGFTSTQATYGVNAVGL